MSVFLFYFSKEEEEAAEDEGYQHLHRQHSDRSDSDRLHLVRQESDRQYLVRQDSDKQHLDRQHLDRQRYCRTMILSVHMISFSCIFMVYHLWWKFQ